MSLTLRQLNEVCKALDTTPESLVHRLSDDNISLHDVLCVLCGYLGEPFGFVCGLSPENTISLFRCFISDLVVTVLPQEVWRP